MNTITVSRAALVSDQSSSSQVSSQSVAETISSTGMYTLLYVYTVNALLTVTTSAVVSDQSSSSASNDDDTFDDDDDNDTTTLKESMYYMLLCITCHTCVLMTCSGKTTRYYKTNTLFHASWYVYNYSSVHVCT